MISTSKDADSTQSFANSSDSQTWNKVIDAKEGLQHAADKAGRKMRGYFDTASGEISHASDTVTTHIRSNPLRSSVIGLAVGYIIGRLFRL